MKKYCRTLAILAVLIGGIAHVSAIAEPSTTVEQIDISTTIINENVSAVTQNGANNRASVEQYVQSGILPGANHATVVQDGQGNAAAVIQNGQHENATIIQQGSNLKAEVAQSGSNLGVKVEQYGAGDGSGVSISQTGVGTSPITLNRH